MFDWYLQFNGFGIHVWSALILSVLVISIIIKTRRLGIFSLIYGAIAGSLWIHIYELHHGLSQFFTSNNTSLFSYLFYNVLFIGVILSVFTLLNKENKVLTHNWKKVFVCYIFFILSMLWLISSGFFIDYPINIVFGVEWVMSKATCGLFILNLFNKKGEK